MVKLIETVNEGRSFEWDQMIKKMNECGIKTPKAIEIIRARKAEFDEACKNYKK